jgi:hypothetical protein
MLTDFEESTIGTLQIRNVGWQHDDVKGPIHPSNGGNVVWTSVLEVKNCYSRQIHFAAGQIVFRRNGCPRQKSIWRIGGQVGPRLRVN